MNKRVLARRNARHTGRRHKIGHAIEHYLIRRFGRWSRATEIGERR
jgi:hypothetical protein